MGTPATVAFDIATALVNGSITNITTMTGTGRDTFYDVAPQPKQLGAPFLSTWVYSIESPDLISMFGGRTANLNVCWARVECRGNPKIESEPRTRIIACRDLLHKAVSAYLSAYSRVWVGRQPFALPSSEGCFNFGIDVEAWKVG